MCNIEAMELCVSLGTIPRWLLVQPQEGHVALLNWMSTLRLLQALSPRKPRNTTVVFHVCEKSCVYIIPIRYYGI